MTDWDVDPPLEPEGWVKFVLVLCLLVLVVGALLGLALAFGSGLSMAPSNQQSLESGII